MFLPHKLTALYPHPGRFSFWQVAVSSALIAGFSWYVISKRRRYPYLAVGWFWYLGTLVPVIGIVQVGIQGLADRYTYIPLIGLLIIVAWGVSALSIGLPSLKKVVSATIALAAISISLGFTHNQIRYWRNSYTLFTHAIEVTPDYWLAYNHMGYDVV